MTKKLNSRLSAGFHFEMAGFVARLMRRFHLRSRFVAVAIPWLLALAPPVVRAGDDGVGCGDATAGSVVARVQSRYDQVSDIEADFEQTTYSVMLAGGGLGEEAPTVGHMQIAKPGRMRWHYREPRESLVLSDGETLWIYDVQAREVTRARVSEGYLAGAALQFLLGEGAIADAFDVVLESCDASGVHLTLTPKEPASYEKLGLVVDGDTGIVRGTTIYDLFGNVTRLRFEDVRFDRSPPAETFIWSASDDVRVIDLESGGGAARGGSSGGSAEEARPSSW